MILELKAKHFKGTGYTSNTCAIEKAVASQFMTTDTMEFVTRVYINDDRFTHISYTNTLFLKDKKKAKKLRYSNQVVRRMRLTLQN